MVGSDNEPVQVRSESWSGVHPKFFTAEAWGDVNNFVASHGYRKFVRLMVRRIARNQSNISEILAFGRMITFDGNWEFMRLALAYLPEFDKPHFGAEARTQMSILYRYLQPKVLERREKNYVHPYLSNMVPIEGGLSVQGMRNLMRSMFGVEEESQLNEQQRRLLKSYIEMGYPKRAIRYTVVESHKAGLPLLRDALGLPTNLRLPPDEQDVRFARTILDTRSALSKQAELVQRANVQKTEAVKYKSRQHVRKRTSKFISKPEVSALKCRSTTSLVTSYAMAATTQNMEESGRSTPLFAFEEAPLPMSDMIRCDSKCITTNPSDGLPTIPECITSHSDPGTSSQAVAAMKAACSKLEGKKVSDDGVEPQKPSTPVANKRNSWPSNDQSEENGSLRMGSSNKPVTPAPVTSIVQFNPLNLQARQPTLAAVLAQAEPRVELSKVKVKELEAKKQGINTQNAPYYLGRRNPGPGDAPPGCIQIGFNPEPDAWKYLYRYSRSSKYDK